MKCVFIWKNNSLGQIIHSSIPYSCDSVSTTGKPIPLIMDNLGHYSFFIASLHVLHNHSFDSADTYPSEHYTCFFFQLRLECQICNIMNRCSKPCLETHSTNINRTTGCFLIEDIQTLSQCTTFLIHINSFSFLFLLQNFNFLQDFIFCTEITHSITFQSISKILLLKYTRNM